jgi:hypothetical protein
MELIEKKNMIDSNIKIIDVMNKEQDMDIDMNIEVNMDEEMEHKKRGGSNRITKTEAQQSMLNRKQKKLVSRLNSAYCRTGKMDRILPILTGKSKISLRLIDWFVTNYAKIFNTHYSINEYKLKREIRNKKGKFITTKTLKKDKILSSTPPTQIILTHQQTLQNSIDSNKSIIENKDEYFNELFFVYPSYRQELKTNSKKRFDVFCRNGSFNYYYDDHKFIETNDGQLNFFDWADNMYVIDYIEEHYNEIEKDMEIRNAKKPRSQKKTQTLKGKKASTIACDNDLETISQKQRRKRREISESSLKTIHHIPHRAIISFD